MSAPTIWVLGGRGLVGQAVCEALEIRGHSPVVTGSEVDITHHPELLAHAEKIRPSHIINCAAMTQVDACEDAAHLPRAMAVNGDGPGHLARVARAVGAAILHISSDYVFDGIEPTPRVEHDPVGPKSGYGHSKLRGEEAFTQALDGSPLPNHILRTSWVFGPGGGNFVSTMLRHMAQRASVQVVADQHGRPTYTPDLAQAIVRLMGLHTPAASHAPSGIYHFANSGATTWHGLCAFVLEQAQSQGLALACKVVEPVTTSAFPRPAPRPAHSVLDTAKFERATHRVPPHFTAAVAQYLGHLHRSGSVSPN